MTALVPLRRHWRTQPPSPVKAFDKQNPFGAACIWACVPGWYSVLNADGIVRSVGQEMQFPMAAGTGGSGGTTDIGPGAYGKGVGNAKAIRFTPGGATSGHFPLRTDADLGIIFPDDRAFTVVTLSRLSASGVDSRVFTKDIGWNLENHDLMLGVTSGGNARTRVRFGSTIVTIIGSSFQADALNMIATTVQPSGANTQAVLHLLREDGTHNRTAGAAQGSPYTPRTSTDMAIGCTAGPTSQFATGDIIWIAAFDAIYDDRKFYDQLISNPWQIFEPRTIWIPAGVASGDVNISATTDALVLTEQQAGVALDININASLDALVLAEQNASVALDVDIQSGVDALVLTEQNASVALDIDISAGFDALVLAEFSTSIALDVGISAATDALTLVMFQASVSTGVVTRLGLYGGTRSLYGDFSGKQNQINVSASVDALILTEFQASIAVDVNVSAGVQNLVLSEFQAGIANDVIISASTDALTLTEFVADIEITGDVNVSATRDALVLTEFSASILAPIVGSAGGHFIPGLAGVRSGKRKPSKALEAATEILDQVVAEVLDTPEKPVKRVSRRLKSQIIEIATRRLLDERVLIGEIDALDRAAASLAKLAIKRRIEARKKVVPIRLPEIEIIPDTDQEIASFMFGLLTEPDPQRDRALAQLKLQEQHQKDIDEELIVLMQILLML